MGGVHKLNVYVLCVFVYVLCVLVYVLCVLVYGYLSGGELPAALAV